MKKNFFLIMLISLLGLYSCKKNNAIVTKVQTADVYVAGVENNGSFDVAKYWKNGAPVILSDGNSQACANSIVVVDSNVYVSGWVRNSSTQIASAVYWKNGIAVNLTDGSLESYGTSIAVSGNDVYVAGSQQYDDSTYKSIAMYWKNGSLVNLSPGYVATSIAVSGTDVYVAGNSGLIDTAAGGATGPIGGTGNSIVDKTFSSGAVYWKNGSLVILNPGGNLGFWIFSIAVSGNDVYVAGTQGYNLQAISLYWKNGNPVELLDHDSNTIANSIAVAGSDVYVAGAEFPTYSNNPRAQYWKNGTGVILPDMSHLGYANSIAVAGNDVYVAGVEYPIETPDSTGPSIATYWKNGNLVNLTDGSKNAVANSIYISTH